MQRRLIMGRESRGKSTEPMEDGDNSGIVYPELLRVESNLGTRY